jgi:mevalonate kinase
MSDQRTRPSQGHGISHAKVILFGEHAALYGGPAIVWPLTELTVRSTVFPSPIPGLSVAADATATGRLVEQDPGSTLVIAANAALAFLDRNQVALRVEVRNSIPVARGLGASAAMAAAVVDGVAAACQLSLSDQNRFHAVQLAETEAHGRSSGIDIRGVTADVPIIIERGTVTPLPPSNQCTLVVADSGTPSHTVESVSAVARAVTTSAGSRHMERLKDICSMAAEAARSPWNPTVIGTLMHDAHAALRALGVSSTEVDHMVSAAAQVPGVHGVKVTGGGMGGAIVAMTTGEAAAAAARAMTDAGARHCWTIPVQGGALL